MEQYFEESAESMLQPQDLITLEPHMDASC